MRNIRKGKTGEIKEILNVINSSFEPVRYKGYDISNSITKIYKSEKDYSNIHCIIEENGKMIATSGNLLNKVCINGKEYPFSITGSVSTLPTHQNSGCMKEMLKFIDNENIQNNVIFSMLTGLRHRYNYFGYEKLGFKFCFEINKHFAKHQQNIKSIKIEEFNQKYLDQIYEIYLKSQAFVLRKKEEFQLILEMYKSEIFVIKQENQIIGYFNFAKDKSCINEIEISNYKFIPFALKSFIENFNIESLIVYASPFKKELIKTLDSICETKYNFDKLHFKVYDIIKFIEMTINLNLKIKKMQNLQKIIKIDTKNIKITIFDKKVKVEETNETFEREFTQREFLRYAYSINSIYDNDNLFPLLLDFENCDLF